MIIGIVQARIGSARLPGKVMEKIEAVPMIGLLLERLKQCQKFDQIVLATTIQKEDDRLADYVKSTKTPVFRGSENDVLDRFYQCAKGFRADHIGRITGDCPLIDPIVIDEMIVHYLQSDVDYLSNDYQETTFPDGLDFEIFSFKTLEETWKTATLRSDREHVSPYILKNDRFKRRNFPCRRNLSGERWTVDESRDLEKVRAIFRNLYPKKKHFSMWDILEFLNKNPEIAALNKNIKRNEGYQKSLKEESREARKKS